MNGAVFAQSNEQTVFDSANAAYSRGDFEKAITGYERIISEGKFSGAIYFNLGNAYYKTNNIGKAILNYERSKKFSDDDDLEANLNMALKHTQDNIDKAPELFLTEWKNAIVNLMSEKNWSLFCIVFLCLTLFFIGLYIFSGATGIRKMGFFGGLVFLGLTIVLFFVAKNKYELTINSSEAIITSAEVIVKGSPDEKSTKLFSLHEGTKVDVQQENGDWIEIRIANGNVGWVKSNVLEKI
jgi:tetratricopeptide (TPR) repeat protein